MLHDFIADCRLVTHFLAKAIRAIPVFDRCFYNGMEWKAAIVFQCKSIKKFDPSK